MKGLRCYALLSRLLEIRFVARLTGGATNPFSFAGALAEITVPRFVFTIVPYGVVLLAGNALDGLICWIGRVPAIYSSIDSLDRAGSGFGPKKTLLPKHFQIRGECTAASAQIHPIHMLEVR